jgi:mannitol-1-phosphate 5-dehydrogenase
MGHAVCAYFGLLRGCETIPEAVSDPYVRLFTQSAMTEAAAMLSLKYDVPFTKVYDHAEDLLLRFGNRVLSDTCERVGRDPMRKLKSGDRFAGALCRCFEYGVHPVYIALGYAAAMHSLTNDAGQAEHIALTHGGLSDEQSKLVLKLFALIELPAQELMWAVERIKKELRGDIV